jgi:F1F0 ATPase subunit 2
MTDFLSLAGALAAGLALGAMFFGGLWWTVNRGLSSAQPALWFFVSMTVRMGLILAGLYLVGHGDWRRLVACLMGILVARMTVNRMTHRAP